MDRLVVRRKGFYIEERKVENVFDLQGKGKCKFSRVYGLKKIKIKKDKKVVDNKK